jgi:hypothetical protein
MTKIWRYGAWAVAAILLVVLIKMGSLSGFLQTDQALRAYPENNAGAIANTYWRQMMWRSQLTR